MNFHSYQNKLLSQLNVNIKNFNCEEYYTNQILFQTGT